MDKNTAQELINQGEGITIEFKRCKTELGGNVFDTVSAFLNNSGGYLFLGVLDNGDIDGVDEKSIQSILNSFGRNANNPEILNPTYYFNPEVVNIDDKVIISIYIPQS